MARLGAYVRRWWQWGRAGVALGEDVGDLIAELAGALIGAGMQCSSIAPAPGLAGELKNQKI